MREVIACPHCDSTCLRSLSHHPSDYHCRDCKTKVMASDTVTRPPDGPSHGLEGSALALHKSDPDEPTSNGGGA